MKRLALLIIIVPILLLARFESGWEQGGCVYESFGQFDSITIANPPSSDNSGVTKDYVDKAVVSLGVRYFLLDDASDVSGYKKMSLDVSSDVEKYLTASSLADGDTVATFISDTAETPEKLLKGLYILEVTTEKTSGNKKIRLTWQLVLRDSTGSETVIATSNPSSEISSKNVINMTIVTDSNYVIDTGSRIVIRLIANVTGTGGAPTIKVYYEGNVDSYMEVPANHEIFDNIFVPYNGAIKDLDLGNNAISGGNATFSGNVGIGTDNPNYPLTISTNIAEDSTDTVFSLINNGIARMALYNTGIQEWTIQSAGVERGKIAYGTPNACLGIMITRANGANRFDMTNIGSYFNFRFNADPWGDGLNIVPGGKVGIGTTNPSSKLDVNGNGHFSGNVTVDGKVSDYVEGYKIITSGFGIKRGGNVQFNMHDDHTYYGYDITQSDAYIIWDIQKTFGHFDTLIVDSVAYKLYGTFNDSDTVIIRVDTLPSNNPVFNYWTEYIDTIALSGSGWHYQDITSSLWSAKIYGENPYKSIFLIKRLGAGSANSLNVIYMKVYYKMWR